MDVCCSVAFFLLGSYKTEGSPLRQAQKEGKARAPLLSTTPCCWRSISASLSLCLWHRTAHMTPHTLCREPGSPGVAESELALNGPLPSVLQKTVILKKHIRLNKLKELHPSGNILKTESHLH